MSILCASGCGSYKTTATVSRVLPEMPMGGSRYRIPIALYFDHVCLFIPVIPFCAPDLATKVRKVKTQKVCSMFAVTWTVRREAGFEPQPTGN